MGVVCGCGNWDWYVKVVGVVCLLGFDCLGCGCGRDCWDVRGMAMGVSIGIGLFGLWVCPLRSRFWGHGRGCVLGLECEGHGCVCVCWDSTVGNRSPLV